MNLKTKKLLNEAVTGETKRCLAILRRLRQEVEHNLVTYNKIEDFHNDYDQAVKEIIEGSPYIEFNQELLKRIPK